MLLLRVKLQMHFRSPSDTGDMKWRVPSETHHALGARAVSLNGIEDVLAPVGMETPSGLAFGEAVQTE